MSPTGTTTVLVLGDSVPGGERTDATAWPERLPALVDGLDDARVAVRGSMGTAMADLTVEAASHVDELAEKRDDGRVAALVHAGHNDAQLSGGEPRVTETRFRAAAAEVDATLALHPAVERRAFVGLVPLLPDRGVPFADTQPDRSLAYDDALAETVETHLPVARPTERWCDRTADGVHPNDAGHAFVARRVAEWVGAEE